MPPILKPKRERRPNFLRQWRKARGFTLATVGEEVGMNGTNLGRIEKGEVPYSQDLLEGLADLYGCEVADLLMRDPSDPDGMWSIWDKARPGEREQIVKVAKALVTSADDDAASTPRVSQSQAQLRRKPVKNRPAKAG